jgi:predicted peptidase
LLLVILFLHGHGLEGDDGWRPTTIGLGPAIKAREDSFPFIVVFPQSRERWAAGTDDMTRAMAMLDKTIESYACDTNRISITGFSQGGHGTWCLAVADPSRWAAMVIVAGFAGKQLGEAEKIAGASAWLFHGENDGTVPYDLATRMVDALKDAGGDPKLTTDDGTDYPVGDKYPHGTHNRDWFNQVYANDDLYEWFLEQVKSSE